MPKSTPEQTFTKLYNLANDPATPEHMRESAKCKMTEWLKRHGKTERDYPAIFAKAADDDKAQKPPPPPPPDPRDGAPHPFDNPEFTPAGLVEGIVAKYVTMDEHVSVISSLWTVFTHVYLRFSTAPRLALGSEGPQSGKSTLRKVVRHLVYRPNEAALCSGAALERFIDRGPGTALLDELDLVDADTRRRLQRIWNYGHERDAKISLVIEGREKLFSIYAPMLAAGIGNFLAPTQESRTYSLDMKPYTVETKPPRDYNVSVDVGEFDAVYSYIRNWVGRVELNPDPPMPPGVILRSADNARGLLAVADACGPEWGYRARAAVTFLFKKEQAERPKIPMVRHGLVIFDALGVDQIGSVRFNKELRQLDLPDARWTRYRGASGMEYAHPIEMHEQAALLEEVGIYSERVRPPGEKQCRGYKRAQFEEALRKYGPAPPDDAEPGRARLRRITPQSD